MVARNPETPVTHTAVTEPSVVRLPANVTDTGLPDLRGMSAREALRELARMGLTARMEGVGFVIDQHPPAGAPLEPGATCTLVLNRVLPRQTGVIGDQR
jgi:beta-lactam-binding protein with PASTA domain